MSITAEAKEVETEQTFTTFTPVPVGKARPTAAKKAKIGVPAPAAPVKAVKAKKVVASKAKKVKRARKVARKIAKKSVVTGGATKSALTRPLRKLEAEIVAKLAAVRKQIKAVKKLG